MIKKKLPIVIDNYVKSECWTNLLLSIIQTSEYASAWIASHLGIIGVDDMKCWYGNLSKIFSYRDCLDILNFEEVNIWSVPTDSVVEFIRKEINKENYIVVELKHEDSATEKGYWIHEQLIFGYDDEKRELYGSVLNNQTGSFIEISITYDDFISTYRNSYEHFKDPGNKDDFIYWSRSNFLISRISLRKDYFPHGCEYDFLQNLIIEADGKVYTSTQYDSEKNVVSERKMYNGAACLLAGEQYMEVLWHDRHFVDKDTDIEYNDLFGRLSFKLAKDIYKLYEHRKIILDSLHWFYTITGVTDPLDSPNYIEYEQCCKDMEIYYTVALKFNHLRDWEVLRSLKECFPSQYKKEHRVLNNLVREIKDIWYTDKSYRI